MKWISLLPIVGLCIGLSACSLMQRHARSGYYGQTQDISPGSATDFYQLRKAHDQQEALEEMGINPTRPLGESEQVALEHRLQLKRMEEEIPTRRERQQYYRYKAFLPSDLARITLLRIPTVEARARWINRLGVSDDDSQGYSEDLAQVIENSDIVVGMSQKAVTESWGDPDLVETAGDPIYRNQRWKYAKYVSSEDGYRKEMRVIYFEGGRVVGWETL